MIKVKVSTPWKHIDFSTRVPKVFDGEKYNFDFSASCIDCDFWIIWGGLKKNSETVFCPPKNIIYLTDEVHNERYFYQQFLNQFSTILTCRTDLHHSNIIHTHELNTWMIERDFDWLCTDIEIPKQKLLSVVSSDQTWLPGHKLRFAFVNKLIGHFKDKIDVYGRGFQPIKDKYDALAPYKYSIAIENSVIKDYFTEKIADCYLTHTMPVYFGCPNIADYFDSNTMRLINPNNFEESISKIEQLLQEDPFDEILPKIKLQKMKYMEKYHVFNYIVNFLDDKYKIISSKKMVTIKAEHLFKRGHVINNIIGRSFNRLSILDKWHFQLSFHQGDLFSNKNLSNKL